MTLPLDHLNAVQTRFAKEKDLQPAFDAIGPFLNFTKPGAGLLRGIVSAFLEQAESLFQKLGNREPAHELPPQQRFEALLTLLAHYAYGWAMARFLREPSGRNLSLASTARIPKLASLGDEPVAWDYGLLEAHSGLDPFWSLYRSHFFHYLTAVKISETNAHKITQQVEKLARRRLASCLCKPGDGPSWLTQWLQPELLFWKDQNFDQLREEIDCLLANQPGPSGSHAAWKTYLQQLCGGVDLPLVGCGHEWCFGLRNLFVAPAFAYQFSRLPETAGDEQPINAWDAAMDAADNKASRMDILKVLTHLIGHGQPARAPIFLMGPPGCGKTSLLTVWAAALAQHGGVFPIYVPLNHIAAKSSLGETVETYLRETPLRPIINDLAQTQGTILILDGFETWCLHRDLPLQRLFEEADKLAANGGRFAGSQLVFSGDVSHLEDVATAFPPQCHLIQILPFDKRRVGLWTRNWNNLLGLTGINAFNGLLYWEPKYSGKSQFSHMTRQPLLLHLLAVLHAAGNPLEFTREASVQVHILRAMIDWICGKEQLDKATPVKKLNLEPQKTRAFLRMAGFAIQVGYKARIEEQEVKTIMMEAGLDWQEFGRGLPAAAKHQYLSYALRRSGRSGWIFLHFCLGEYLAAEYFFEELRAIVKVSSYPQEASRRWTALFAPAFPSASVTQYLLAMLRQWSVVERDFFTQFMALAETMYSRGDAEEDWSVIGEMAKLHGLPPSKAQAHLAAGTLLMGSLGARIASQQQKIHYFQPEVLVRGSWFRTYGLLQRWFNMASLAQRVFPMISLDAPDGLDTSGGAAQGKYFGFLHLSKIAGRYACFKGAFLVRTNLMGGQFSHANFKNAVLTHANLERAQLCGADFSGADMGGVILNDASLNRANLRRAGLQDAALVNADLRKTVLLGADLRRANLSEAQLQGANLGRVNLKRADLSGANMTRTNLRGADLRAVNLSHAELSYANMAEVQLEEARLKGADFTGANFANGILRKLDFQGVNFTGADLSNADLRDANLTRADFGGANLSLANLRGAWLGEASLTGCNLIGASLFGTDLAGAVLRGAVLFGVDLRNADFSGTDFQVAVFQNTNLTGADLTAAKNLTLDQIRNAIIDKNTRLPSYLIAALRAKAARRGKKKTTQKTVTI